MGREASGWVGEGVGFICLGEGGAIDSGRK